ncbi:hypothetical protein CHS0354_031873 [Potamilus streckersoni]|uniref:PKD/REJ-like domain-containing protein n=1 Tax=Potamilus streckersoni TaxID=2493646 RepID=A0AAE0RXQ7_9BIVA|nr:hypothetical protein CHS0354_031873 [Potamilus streckersoni]
MQPKACGDEWNTWMKPSVGVGEWDTWIKPRVGGDEWDTWMQPKACGDEWNTWMKPRVGGGGKTVTLAVSVTLNTFEPITSTVVAKVVCRKPVPVITGGSEVEVGVGSGQIIIDGSRTFDPENAEVTYKWECLQGPASSSEEPANNCISHLPSESINITFPTDREKSKANLTFDAARFSAGRKYKFILTATSVKGGTTFNDTISIMYTAVDGNMPLVEILTTKRKFRSDVVIIIEARLRSSVQVVTEWSFVEDTGYDTKNITAVGKQTISPGRVTNTYISQLEISKDTLSAGAKYKVKLRVSHVSNSSIFIETCTEIAVYEDITGCTINARDYAEYDMTAIEFLGCATDSEGYPLTYTLQLSSQILATTSDTILKIPGPPLKDRTLTNATFTVIVRNSVGQVKTFESQEVKVTKKSKEVAALAAESLIAEAESTGDIVAALTHLNNKITSLQTTEMKDVKKALTFIKDIRENQLSPMNASKFHLCNF